MAGLSAKELERILRELEHIQAEMEKYADQLEDTFQKALVSANSNALHGVGRVLADAPNFQSLSARARIQWWIDHKNAIEDALVRSGYKGAVVDYVNALPRFAAFVNELMSAQGESFLSFPQKTLEFLKGRATEQFVHAGARANLALQDLLYGQVFSGRANSAAIDALREALPPAYERYAGTYARTNHFRFARELSAQQADTAGAEHFLYTGPVDESNRPFCRRLMANPVQTRAEIEAMDNHQGPEVANVFTNGGGYNCRHSWVAISAKLAERIRAKLAAAEEAPIVKNEPATAPATRMAGLDLTTAPEGWQEFKRVADAQRWAIEHGLAREMVDYRGLNITFVNKLNYEMGILAREFPDARTGFLGSQASAISWLRMQGVRARVSPGAYGGYRSAMVGGKLVDAIVYPAAKYGGARAVEESKAFIQGMIDRGWLAKYESDDLLRRAIYHEFGHALDGSKRVFESQAFKALVKSWEQELGGPVPAQWIKDNICEYAIGYPWEVFSEGWAEYILSKSPRKPARQLAELLLRAHGKR